MRPRPAAVLAVPAVAAAFALAALFGPACLAAHTPGSGAAFTARTDNLLALSTTTVAPPSSLVAAASGAAVDLTWTGGTGAYVMLGAPATVTGGTPTCPATLAVLAGTSTTAYRDTGQTGAAGGWYCYQVASSLGSWRSHGNPVTTVRTGFVVSAVRVVNDGDHSACARGSYGQPGVVDCGDQVVVTFNQPVDQSSGPQTGDTVCADGRQATVSLFGTTAHGNNCSTTEPTDLGTLSGAGTGNRTSRYAATYAWSPDGTSVTVTIGARMGGHDVTMPDPTAFQPTATTTRLLSATGGIHVCDSDTSPSSECLPVPTGGF